MKQNYVRLICPFYSKPSIGKAQTDRLLETLTVKYPNRIMCLHLHMVGQGRWQERFKNWIQLQLHIMNPFLPSHLYSRAIVLSSPQAAPPSYMKLCIVFFSLYVFSSVLYSGSSAALSSREGELWSPWQWPRLEVTYDSHNGGLGYIAITSGSTHGIRESSWNQVLLKGISAVNHNV